MSKLFDLMVPNGEYTDKNTGQQKTRWLRIGAIMTTQAGKQAMKLDCLPISAEFDGWVQMFEPNQDRQNLHTANAPQQPVQGFRQPQQQPAQPQHQQPAQPAVQQAPPQQPAQPLQDDDIPW